MTRQRYLTSEKSASATVVLEQFLQLCSHRVHREHREKVIRSVFSLRPRCALWLCFYKKYSSRSAVPILCKSSIYEKSGGALFFGLGLLDSFGDSTDRGIVGPKLLHLLQGFDGLLPAMLLFADEC